MSDCPCGGDAYVSALGAPPVDDIPSLCCVCAHYHHLAPDGKCFGFDSYGYEHARAAGVTLVSDRHE